MGRIKVQLENGEINSRQLSLLIVGFIFGSSIVLSPGGQAKQAAWIAILLGMIEGIFFAFIYIHLCRRFPKKTLVEIHDLVFGPYLGKLISLLFLWYFFHLGSLVIDNFKDFISITILPRTPDLLLSVLLILISVYAVKKGIEVLARCNQVLILLVIGLFSIIIFFLLKDIHLHTLQPIFDIPIKDFFWAVHSACSFPFAETVAFSMIIPFLNESRKGTVSIISGILIGGFILVLAAIKNTGVLGASTGVYVYQNFQADRMVNISNLLTRLEILTVIAAITTGFIKISILLYSTVLGGAQLLGLRSYRPLITPIAILMILLSVNNFRNIAENVFFAQQIYPFYAFPFQIGIPLITLIIASIRKIPKSAP